MTGRSKGERQNKTGNKEKGENKWKEETGDGKQADRKTAPSNTKDVK